jgi:hypothetical protein
VLLQFYALKLSRLSEMHGGGVDVGSARIHHRIFLVVFEVLLEHGIVVLFSGVVFGCF